MPLLQDRQISRIQLYRESVYARRGKRMFIAVYEFEIEDGMNAEFREAWLEVTKAIYKQCGSFGSRLHLSDKPMF